MARLYSLDAGSNVNALTFSPKNYWFCAATDTSIKVWDVENKNVLDELHSGMRTSHSSSRRRSRAMIGRRSVRSMRASCMDVSLRSPRSPALLPYPTSPRSSFCAESPSARLRLPVSPRSSRDLDLTSLRSFLHRLQRGHRPGKCHGTQGQECVLAGT